MTIDKPLRSVRVAGTLSFAPNLDTRMDVALLVVKDPDKLAYITQTTLSVDDTRGIISALMQRFPTIVGPDVRDICYATQNRQQAVRALALRMVSRTGEALRNPVVPR